MKRSLDEPTRILDLRPQDDPANVARLVRSAIRAPTEQVPRLKARIRCSLRRKSAWRRRYLHAALLGSVVFLTGGVMGAVLQPVLHHWQQRRVESAAKLNPPRPSTRSSQRRVASQPSLFTDQGLLSPVEPDHLPSQSPTLGPGPPPEPSAVRSTPPAATHSPQAESAVARPRPSPARTAVVSSASAAAFAGRSASPGPDRTSAGGEPLRMAMLEPPSLQRDGRPLPAVSSSKPEGDAALFVRPPQPSQLGAERPPAASGDIRPDPAPIRTAPAAPVPQARVPSPPSEQALLSRAVRSLRSEHRPGSALAVLDEYVARFPSGSLLPEAIRLRTEALLALGHKPAALAELNRAPALVGANGEDSRLVRGELRAAAGRWQEALEDFDAVVRAYQSKVGAAASTKLREHFERALWGRASARSHVGDEVGARADLRESLRRFPQGRFAARAVRLLGELR